MTRTYLDVPYKNRGLAKRSGAVWDEDRNRWYIDGDDVPDLLAWYRMGSVDADDVATITLYGKSPFSKKKGFVASVAHVIRCPRREECQLACEGRCLRSDSLNRGTAACPWAQAERITQHRKDAGFERWVKGQPRYNALTRPRSRAFAIIGDLAYVDLRFAEICETACERPRRSRVPLGDSGYEVTDGNPFLNAASFVPLSALTPEGIDTIAKFRPLNIYGEVIRAYADEAVPAFLDDVRRHWPEGWDALVSEFPGYAGNEVDYRGREAFLSTCREGATFKKDAHSAEFVLRDGRLICDNLCGFGSPLPIIGNWHGAKVEIPVTPDMRVRITDNAQVDPDRTVFA